MIISMIVVSKTEKSIAGKVFVSQSKLRMPVDLIVASGVVDFFNPDELTETEASRIAAMAGSMNLDEGEHFLKFGTFQ